jgi:glutamate/tyrosine decarboxylase-like PLP-dependent enzyme
VHQHDAEIQALAQAVWEYSLERMEMDPVPLDAPRTEQELATATGPMITADGIGGPRALHLFAEELAPSCISTDSPRYLSFIPCAPTEAASLFDLVVGASSIYGGTWLEGSGAVHAENEALRWLSGLAGLPETAGGVFVPGGTVGNLSALVTARDQARRRRGAAGTLPARWAVAGTSQAHSSIVSACDVMDVDFIGVPVDEEGRLTGRALREALDASGHDGVFAVIATAGTTNLGIIDDLTSVAQVCEDNDFWFHVDGAYGLAALCAPSVRERFNGIERADSFVVDPHKWLFAPFDCCALIYRQPELARRAHTQRAGYLDVVTKDGEFNPSDYAIGLSRRARGLPFWFSLAVYGTRAYTQAVERTLDVARFATEQIRSRDDLELLHEPDLSVVAFRRRGWTPQQYSSWSKALLDQGTAFVVPTTHHAETVTRLAIVNPLTSEDDISLILDSMA